MSVTLTSLPPDVLSQVALSLAISSDSNPLGPPKHLLSFLLTNKSIYHHLNHRTNAHLFAEIFRYQFDVDSLHRRLPASSLTAPHLAVELFRRWTCLKRIRSQALSPDWRTRVYPDHQLKEDLITVFLMFTESDGRNAIQLIEYGQVHAWVNQYFKNRLVPVHNQRVMPPESDEASLAMWITWQLSDYRALLMEGDWRSLAWLTKTYMLGTFFYKNSYAPWTTFSLPVASANSIRPISPTNLSQDAATQVTQSDSPFFIYDTTPAPLPLVNTTPPPVPPRGRGRHPRSQLQSIPATFMYFGSPLAITAPLVSHAATLVFFARMQNLPTPIPGQPTRTARDLYAELTELESRGLVYSGSSFLAFLSRVEKKLDLDDVAQLMKGKRNFTPEYIHLNLPSLARSENWDDQWARLTGCWNPFGMVRELGMPRFAWTKGCLTGEWDGRFAVPDHGSFEDIMAGVNPMEVIDHALLVQNAQSWSIEEHYYVPASRNNGLAPSPFVSALGPPVRAGHPMHAFIRPDLSLKRVFGARGPGFEVCEGKHDPHTAAFYETWQGGMCGNDVGYSQTTFDALNKVDDDSDDERTMMDVDSEEFDEDEDEVITILITGNAIKRPASIPEGSPTPMNIGATLYGTVRTWDGLITLKANASEPEFYAAGAQPTKEEWIWRGYLVGDGNFVGQARNTEIDVRRNGYEGPFVMRRRVPNTMLQQLQHQSVGKQ